MTIKIEIKGFKSSEDFSTFYSQSNKNVCHECIGNKDLKETIKKNGQIEECDYCHARRKCIVLGDLLELILRGVFSEYEDATGCMGWESAEGGFIGADTYDNYDLIHDVLVDELSISNTELLDDISESIDPSITWCNRDPYSVSEDVGNFYLWENFSSIVKNKTRFMFHKIPLDEYGESLDIILQRICNSIEKLKLIKKVNGKYIPIYRGRTHSINTVLKDKSDFYSPPDRRAKSSRMSSEGISMLYGAFDINTTLAEIKNEYDEFATVAEIRLRKPLYVVDLTLPRKGKIPSIFSDSERELRTHMRFIKDFSENISRKASEPNSIDYVPTQIVTEYIWHVYKPISGIRIDGLIYWSSQRKYGKCLVLFLNNDDCAEQNGIIYIDERKIQRFAKEFNRKIESQED